MAKKRTIGEMDIFKASMFMFLGICVLLLIGSVFWREMFWDGFLWKYYFGPIYADAENSEVDGISEGYNPVNTLTYGLILAFAVYYIHNFLRREGIKVDGIFALAILPYILLGSTLRVLEDANFFSPPFIYLMISPLIYILIGMFTLLMIYLGVMYRNSLSITTSVSRPHNASHRGIIIKLKITPPEEIILFTSIALFMGYLFLYLFSSEEFLYLENPIFPGVIIVVLTYVLWKKGNFYLYVAFNGIFLFLISIYHLGWWSVHHAEELRLHVVPVILILTLLFWAGTIIFLKKISRHLSLPIELKSLGPTSLMIFSQFLDGAATFIGIDFYGYYEKHVLPSLLIEVTGTAAVMFLLKFIMLVSIIYLLDVEYRRMMNELPVMNGLIRIVVVILGMAPGTRDMLWLALGT